MLQILQLFWIALPVQKLMIQKVRQDLRIYVTTGIHLFYIMIVFMFQFPLLIN